ncbi:MAG: DUF3237 domain-containing protein [Parvularculaceae bacterium]|nr:DUF3237 domain-containing protein [Parvularculaceae bacterium]
MKLVHEMTFRAMLKPPLAIGAGPIGTRMYYELTGGEVVGDRLRGKVLGGGEWALIASDGYLRADVRAQVETHDGAALYVQYVGLLEMNAAVQSATETGSGTEFSDQRFYTNPRFETGDAQYAWVNTTFFIGEGRILPGLGVEYRVWRPA